MSVNMAVVWMWCLQFGTATRSQNKSSYGGGGLQEDGLKVKNDLFSVFLLFIIMQLSVNHTAPCNHFTEGCLTSCHLFVLTIPQTGGNKTKTHFWQARAMKTQWYCILNSRNRPFSFHRCPELIATSCKLLIYSVNHVDSVKFWKSAACRGCLSSEAGLTC